MPAKLQKPLRGFPTASAHGTLLHTAHPLAACINLLNLSLARLLSLIPRLKLPFPFASLPALGVSHLGQEEPDVKMASFIAYHIRGYLLPLLV